MRLHTIGALVASVMICALTAVRAQSTVGHIRGAVVDATGTAIPGATVSIAPGPRGGRASIVTDEKGGFAFFGLDPGRYMITASLAGFRDATTATAVRAGETAMIGLTLEIASTTESITVTGGDASRYRRPQTGARYPLPSGYNDTRAHRRRRFNTEAYDRIDDNPWIEVARTPLSTFSSDVDTASYANVRRFLDQAQAPPKDAVRIEELINYFTYDYPEPHDGQPVAVTTAVGACPWNPPIVWRSSACRRGASTRAASRRATSCF